MLHPWGHYLQKDICHHHYKFMRSKKMKVILRKLPNNMGLQQAIGKNLSTCWGNFVNNNNANNILKLKLWYLHIRRQNICYWGIGGEKTNNTIHNVHCTNVETLHLPFYIMCGSNRYNKLTCTIRSTKRQKDKMLKPILLDEEGMYLFAQVL